MAKGSYGRSKAARRADSGSYLTVLPTPELPYETESADRIYSRQAPSERPASEATLARAMIARAASLRSVAKVFNTTAKLVSETTRRRYPAVEPNRTTATRSSAKVCCNQWTVVMRDCLKSSFMRAGRHH